MKSGHFNDRSIPFLFFITTIVAYGLLLPRTGFYWDDWPFAWIERFLGPRAFIPAFDGVRPFLGPIFLVTTSLIPPIPIYWQIFALIIRFIAGLSVWFALNQVWPQHKQQTLAASLLFLLFPGYSQHWVAFTHINQEWIPLIFLLLSFGFTGYALRNPSSFRKSTIIALLLLVLGVFPTEYFIGFELMRFFFIWAIVQQQQEDLLQRLLHSIKLWLPYFVIWLGNVLWLAYFYTLGNYDSYHVKIVNESIYRILAAIGDAIWKAGFYIWGQIVFLIAESMTAPSTLLTLVLIAVTLGFFIYYFSRMESNSPQATSFTVTVLFAGIVGIIAGRLPSFAAGLPLTLQSSNDRFMISMMLGGSLFIVGVVDLLIRNSGVRTYVFALLIALSVGQQFFNANIFRRDWDRQQQIFWQLAWRIPAMQPGTALITDEIPIDYETDLSLTAPLNWMYAPGYTRSDLPYAMFYTESRLGSTSFPSLAPDTDLFMGMRAANFYGSTSRAIVFLMPENGCLRVLDAGMGDQLTYAHESQDLWEAIPLSNLDLILVDFDRTPKLPFLREPEHRWCYYYTKAELARQVGDWHKVITLFDEASALGYQPDDPFEWLVFIEAHAMTGNIDLAQKLSADAMHADGRVRNGVCQVWNRVQLTAPIECEDGA